MPYLLRFFIFKNNNAIMMNWLTQENAWLDEACAGREIIHVSEAQPGLVVPRSYRGLPHFQAAQAAFAARGWPVHVRLSGGGLVPQNRGILNFHLAYLARASAPLQVAAQHFLALCRILGDALAEWGVHADTQAVSGSFCDGRYNLAYCGRKIAGTAQYWRRHPVLPEHYVVLSHAVLLVNTPLVLCNRMVNEFEAAAGSTRRYQADKIMCVGDICPQPDWLALLPAAIVRHARRVLPEISVADSVAG